MLKKINKLFTSFKENTGNYKKLDFVSRQLSNDYKSVKVNIGQLQSYFNNQKPSIKNLSEVEFQVFSQNGEDGIIQYLINKLDIPNKTFIEFGVENYTESNTRFLYVNNNWSGYVIDGSAEHIRYIEHDLGGWGDLYCKNAFIDKDNINELLRYPGFKPEIGILSIDIDGNDYWVWEKIDSVNPVIIIAEYNSIFGRNTSWTVPYDPAFVRKEKHASQLYYGASLKALVNLGDAKGYYFIGCNTRGNNAFFIRKDKMTNFIEPVSAEQGYVYSKFREARNRQGWIGGGERIKAIAGLDIYDIDTKTILKIDPSVVQY